MNQTETAPFTTMFTSFKGGKVTAKQFTDNKDSCGKNSCDSKNGCSGNKCGSPDVK